MTKTVNLEILGEDHKPTGKVVPVVVFACNKCKNPKFYWVSYQRRTALVCTYCGFQAHFGPLTAPLVDTVTYEDGTKEYRQ